jgi:hypothetical protein
MRFAYNILEFVGGAPDARGKVPFAPIHVVFDRRRLG